MPHDCITPPLYFRSKHLLSGRSSLKEEAPTELKWLQVIASQA